MGHESKIRLVAPLSHEAKERARLQKFANAVKDESHWSSILASAETPASREELERVVGPMLPFRQCLNRACESGEPATWYPVLVCRVYPDASPTRITVSRRVCFDCKTKIALSDVLDDETWDRVIHTHRGLNLPWPTRELTTLTFDAVQ